MNITNKFIALTFLSLLHLVVIAPKAKEGVDIQLQGLKDNLDQYLNPSYSCNTESEGPLFRKRDCAYRKKNKGELSFLNEKWHFDAFGVDLFQKHPIVMSSTPKKSLAIIDDGIRVKSNPKAGKKLISNSPEEFYGQHGTHVIGTAVSNEYGLNPKLNAKAFPVPSKTGGFTFENLKVAVEKAIKDPDVKIMSLSISMGEDPKMIEVIEKAIASGKWVVYAAGNDGLVNSFRSAGMESFNKDVNFFRVGSLNYFGSPSYFSNYGKNVKYFAPGSKIESLNAFYLPNVSNSKKSIIYNGTSMATPFFSSLLQTINDIAPDLSAKEASLLIEAASIRKGTDKGGLVSQINPLLTVELLSKGKECFKIKKASKKEACLNNKLKEIKDKSMDEINKLAQTDKFNDCEEEKLYYDKLRKAYFLTAGNSKVSARVQKFLKAVEKGSNAAEIYFSANGKEIETLEGFSKKAPLYKEARNELSTATKLFSGHYEFSFDDIEEIAHSAKKEDLFKLPATKENLATFLKICFEDINTADVSFLSSTPCQGYLSHSTSKFRDLVVEELLNRKLSPRGLKYLSYIAKRNSTKIKQQIRDKAIQGWKKRKSLTLAILLADKLRTSKSGENDWLIKEVRESIINGDLYYDFRKMSLVSGKFETPPRHEQLKKFWFELPEEIIMTTFNNEYQNFINGEVKRTVSEAKKKGKNIPREVQRNRIEFFYWAVHRKGGDQKTFKTFKDIIKAEKQGLDAESKFFLGPLNESTPFLYAISNPVFVTRFANYIMSGKNLEKYCRSLHYSNEYKCNLEDFLKVSKKLGKENLNLANKLLSFILKKRLENKKIFYNFHNWSEYLDDDFFKKYFSLSDDLFDSSVELNEIQLAYLEKRLQEEDFSDSYSKKFKRVTKLSEEDLYRNNIEKLNNFDLINSDKYWTIYIDTLRKNLKKERNEYRNSNGLGGAHLSLSRLSFNMNRKGEFQTDFVINDQNFEIIKSNHKKIVSALPLILEGSDYNLGSGMSRMGKYVAATIDSKKRFSDYFNSALATYNKLRSEKAFEGKINHVRGAGSIKFMLEILESDKGQTYLEENPNMVEKLAGDIVKMSSEGHITQMSFSDTSIPKQILKALTKKLPSDLKEVNRIPEWIFPVIKNDPNSIEWSLNNLGKLLPEAINDAKIKDKFFKLVGPVVENIKDHKSIGKQFESDLSTTPFPKSWDTRYKNLKELISKSSGL